MRYISPVCRTNIKFHSWLGNRYSGECGSWECRFAIGENSKERTYLSSWVPREFSAPSPFDSFTCRAVRMRLRESDVKLKQDDAGDRESDGKKVWERGKSGRPSKTGRTGFSGRVGESLYSVSLFLYARFCTACTLESASDTSAALYSRTRSGNSLRRNAKRCLHISSDNNTQHFFLFLKLGYKMISRHPRDFLSIV